MNARKILAVSLSALMLVLLLATVASADSPIVHKVSVGGPDVCEAFGQKPGCDANFSLHAIQYADGSVSGQYTDQFGHGNGGIHAAIDCLVVEGNQAWIGGQLTNPGFEYLRVGTRVADVGTSANDPPDQISFTFFEGFSPLYKPCTEKPDYPLFDMPQGQVKVK